MVDPRRADEVLDGLLAHLRGFTAWADASCPSKLQRVFGGNQSHVYSLELEGAAELRGPLILRILRPFLPQESVGREAKLQRVLGDAGYPVASILHHCDDPAVLGGAFQLMQRLPGRPIVGAGSESQGTIGLREALADFRVFVFGAWPEQVSELQYRLHSMPLQKLLAGLEKAGLPAAAISFSASLARLAERAERAPSAGLRDAFAWLREAAVDFEARPQVLCHGDFFPNQVMTDAGAITGVIDWSDACIAPPELDVAILKVGIETLPVPVPFGSHVLRSRARRFLAAYAKLAPLAPAALEYAEAFRCAHSLLAISERRQALTADPHGPANPNPYDSPAAIAELSARLARISACVVSLG